MQCPFCDAVNIDGTDACESCGQDLTLFDVAAEPTGRLHAAILEPLEQLGLLPALVLGSSSSVADAVALMRGERHGSVIVTEAGRPVGIFTEHDLMTRVEPGADLAAVLLESVMTPDPECLHPSDRVFHGLNQMAQRGNRHLPVIGSDGQLRGYVGVRQLLWKLCESAGL